MPKPQSKAAPKGGKRERREVQAVPPPPKIDLTGAKPCGNWSDFQGQIDARPQLRGNPPTMTIAMVCRLFGVERRKVLRAIDRGDLDVVVQRGVTRVTLESARAGFSPSMPSGCLDTTTPPRPACPHARCVRPCRTRRGR